MYTNGIGTGNGAGCIKHIFSPATHECLNKFENNTLFRESVANMLHFVRSGIYQETKKKTRMKEFLKE